MTWPSSRKRPYTQAGIKRKKCVRCGAQASAQWQVCADHNIYRPICRDCDIALNALVLRWAGHPEAITLIDNYTLANSPA